MDQGDRLITQDSGSETTYQLEALRACQQELAELRRQQETWAEDLAKERRRRRTAEKKLQALSIAVDQQLSATSAVDGGSQGRFSRLRPTKTATDELAEQVQLLESSKLFRGAWYVRQYPESVLSGKSPARHYLEVGAAQGYDPGPKFRTKDYLDNHPGLAESGRNPLVHFLTRTSSKRHGSGKSA